MRKKVNFNKIDFYGTGRKVNQVELKLELRETSKGLEFSCCGLVWDSEHTDIVCGGQCLDTLVPFFKHNKTFMQIHSWWKQYHLNGMHAGTEAQEEALKSSKWGGVNANCYTAQCEYLESIGLLVDNGYKYGSGWLYRAIPQEDLKQIQDFIMGGAE